MMQHQSFVCFFGVISSLICLSSCKPVTDYYVFSTIYGIVTDSTDGEPVSGASVMLLPGSKTQLTGQDGNFQFENLDAKQYTLSVQKTGYQTNRKIVTAISGEDIQVSIQLIKSE